MFIRPTDHPGYWVDGEGSVFSEWHRSRDAKTGRVSFARSGWIHGLTRLRAGRSKSGHMLVVLRGKSVHVHRFVARAFFGACPKGQETRHRDGNPANNWAYNLRYGTRKQNVEDAREHGTLLTGARAPNARFTIAQVLEVLAFRRAGESYGRIGKRFNVSPWSIRDIAKGHTYKEVPRA